MAAKKKSKSAQPQKATVSNEPQVQVYAGFKGMNTSSNPLDWNLPATAPDGNVTDPDAQTDLMSTYVTVQDNIRCTSTGGLESREPAKSLFSLSSYEGGVWSFTGVHILVSKTYYAAIKNGTSYRLLAFTIGSSAPRARVMPLPYDDASVDGIEVTDLTFFDGYLIVHGKQAGVAKFWLSCNSSKATDRVASDGFIGYIRNWKKVINANVATTAFMGNFDRETEPDTFGWTSAQLTDNLIPRPCPIPMGKLKGSTVSSKDKDDKDNTRYISSSKASHRYTFKFCYVNELGVTLPSAASTIYVDASATEFGSGKYIRIYSPNRTTLEPGFSGNWITQWKTPMANWSLSGKNSVFKWSASSYWYPPPDDSTGVDIYASEDDAADFVLIGHVDFPARSPGPYVSGTALASLPLAGLPSTDNEQSSWHRRYIWYFDWYGGFMDTGIWAQRPADIPEENSTDGAPCTYSTEKDQRLYFWGDPAMPHRLYVGGATGNEFSIARGLGGAWLDHGYNEITSDGKSKGFDEIKSVLRFRTYNASTIMTALFDNPNTGRTQRSNVLQTEIAFTDTNASTSFAFEDVEGVPGCNSFHGAGTWYDGLYYTTRRGLALTTIAAEANNQVRVDYPSSIIENFWQQQVAGSQKNTWLTCIDDIIYCIFGGTDGSFDEIIFCYDIGLKTWYTMTLPASMLGQRLRGLCHIDWEGSHEGLGVITDKVVTLIPTTQLTPDSGASEASMKTTIVTAEMSRYIPLQQMQYISQLEFRFDYIDVGEGDRYDIWLLGVDYYGRDIEVYKKIDQPLHAHNYSLYMRVDSYLEAYKLVMIGKGARFKMTHILAKQYPSSNQAGLVYGYDDRIKRSRYHTSHSDRSGTIHHYLASYNDLADALIP